ncbi:MAG: phosphoenolpyruvate--protein phosphotransferase [Gammaproteobacteria bacterium]|nr:MAG: phosphoenolpyruvate--protein phosphotransferase [Gammaproteobacteria bacterium]TLZ05625.1 MAG: phosphoenolpyruvate--protein phosphotransferase [Gammaproteobacteria bacterium]
MSAVPRRIGLLAPLSGILVPLERVPDPVFAQRTVGDGVSIDPTSCDVLAPAAGLVTLLHRAAHALAITTDEGVEILVHIGVDTVSLNGKGFTARVSQGDRVAAGQPLISFDADLIARSAPSLLTQVLVTNRERIRAMTVATGLVDAGRSVILDVELAAAPAVDGAPATEATAVSADIRLPNRQGLHARPAAVVAAAAKAFRADIRLLRGADAANAKSVTSILLLATNPHDAIRVSATGPDAAAAVSALAELLACGSGESQASGESAVPAAGPVPAAVAAPAIPAAPTDPRKLAGVSASPGVALGKVAQVRRTAISVAEQGAGLERERAHLDAALTRARQQISAQQAANSGAASRILDAHLELLADPELIDLAVAGLAGGRSAGFAWREAYSRYAARLEALASALLRERAGDVRDVGGRVLGLLAGVTTAPLEFAPGSILIADELTPSETASLDAGRVLGLCTTGGGPTSHAAILARALGLPAVCGVDRAALELEDGTAVLLDGTGGTLLKNPDETEVAAARAVMGRLAAQRHSERAAASEPAATTDGHRIEIAANIGTAEEAVAAVAHGAEAVGLLRSELLFLDRDTAPEEREQAEVYRAVAAALGRGRRLVIRTLDVGGDKPLAYLPLPAEQNPFLGLRGIRVSLERPDLLRSQLRAILAAAALSDVHVMFPMIATLDELRAARRILAEEQAGGASVRVGVMIEVPSAALTAEHLAREVDFFSIGTNDLTQYTLAMDRGHPRLAALADALHPAVLKLISLTVEAAHRHGKWVGVCGGMAAEPLAVPVLLGIGVDELSVPVPAIAAVKALVRRLSLRHCRDLAREVAGLSTAGEVRARLAQFGREARPAAAGVGG